MKVIALNVGNSTLAVALFEDGVLAERRSFPAEGGEDALSSLDKELRALGAGAVPSAAASVNAPLLEKILSRLSFPLHVAGSDFAIPIENGCRRPGLTGHDRLLDALAASHLYGSPVIAVDFGTALTFNLVDGLGIFQGGAILPGIGLAARALSSGCFQLPRVEASGEPPCLGRDTDEAIASGLLNGYVGLVDHMIACLAKEAGAECRTIATGGEAPLIAPRSRAIDLLDEALTLRGLVLAFEASLG